MATPLIHLDVARQHALDWMKALMDAAFFEMRVLSPDEATYFDWLKERVEAIDVEMMLRRTQVYQSEIAHISTSSSFHVAKPRAVKTKAKTSRPVSVWRDHDVPATAELQPLVFPVTVTEVESLPLYLDHKISDQLQRRANQLVNLNYRSLMSTRRLRSRRYEGWHR